MKTVIMLIMLSALGFSELPTFQQERTWTNEEGKKIKGWIVDATDKEVVLTVDGKNYRMSIGRLSPMDMKHIDLFKLRRPVKLRKQMTAWHNRPGVRGDGKTLEIDLALTQNRKLKVYVVWLGDDGNKKKYGIHKVIKQDVKGDGKYTFDINYPNWKKKKHDKNYRGYVIKVVNEAGEIVAKDASQQPFLRFLEGVK